jgi:hypothetical protein
MGDMPSSPELAKELAELIPLQQAVANQSQQQSMTGITETTMMQLLEEAKAIAARYHPANMTVTVGVPFGASVSFTWDMPKDGILVG